MDDLMKPFVRDGTSNASSFTRTERIPVEFLPMTFLPHLGSRLSGEGYLYSPHASPRLPWLALPPAPRGFSTLSRARPSSWSRSGSSCCTSPAARRRPRKIAVSRRPACSSCPTSSTSCSRPPRGGRRRGSSSRWDESSRRQVGRASHPQPAGRSGTAKMSISTCTLLQIFARKPLQGREK